MTRCSGRRVQRPNGDLIFTYAASSERHAGAGQAEHRGGLVALHRGGLQGQDDLPRRGRTGGSYSTPLLWLSYGANAARAEEREGNPILGWRRASWRLPQYHPRLKYGVYEPDTWAGRCASARRRDPRAFLTGLTTWQQHLAAADQQRHAQDAQHRPELPALTRTTRVSRRARRAIGLV